MRRRSQGRTAVGEEREAQPAEEGQRSDVAPGGAAQAAPQEHLEKKGAADPEPEGSEVR